MQFDCALLEIQDVRFAVVIVRPHVLNSSICEEVRCLVSRTIQYKHIIFLTKDFQGKPTYHGRLDIARLLSKINPYKLPFKTFYF